MKERIISADALYNKALQADLYEDSLNEIINLIDEAPTVSAVVVTDTSLRGAINMLINQYEHSKASDYVHSPIAHALYHTWKRWEEKENHGST